MKKLKTKYLSFQTQKGGSGKTTLCTIIAGLLINDGYKVLVVDTDFQECIVDDIEEGREPIFDIVAKPRAGAKELNEYLEQVDGKYDYILIDTPASIGGKERSYVLQISDLVVIPLVGAKYDLKSTMKYLRSISLITKSSKIPMLGVRNKWSVRKENRELIKLKGYTGDDGYVGLIINEGVIHYWVDYSRDVSVHEPMINEETKELYSNVLKFIK